VIDNRFLESLDIGTDEGWIVERVGIRSRRTVLDLDYIRQTRNQDPRAAAEASSHTNAETGALAARMAMDRAGVSAEDIGMVLAGGCSPQWSIPAEACMVAHELGIEAPSLDLSSACSTFAAQLHTLAQYRADALPDYVLIVQPENTTRTVDYSDRSIAVLWGDGTTAAVVSSRHVAQARLLYTTLHSDPSGWDKVRIPAAGHFEQDGRAVQRFAIRKGGATLRELLAQADKPGETVFIGHQANLLALQGMCRQAEIPEDRHLHNVVEFGNCGAAGAASVLSQHWGDFSQGQELALAVVGSGLTWGGALIRFGDSHAL
jgi:3-oxoacyl-[acyl-carrier-protein] synthase-3